MANPVHLAKFEEGVDAWNKWRRKNPTIVPSLSKADAVLKYLSKANLCGTDLSDADLKGSNLRRADLHGANLHGANLFGTNLRWADLSGANLRGANLSEADLDGAKLIKADLGNATLVKSNLKGADLSGADLGRAKLCESNLIRASLKEASLREAAMSQVNLLKANLREADLRGADLSGAKLIESNLILVALRDAILVGANLRRANLRRANLRGVDLRNAILVGAKINERDLDGTIYNPEQLKDMIISRPATQPLIGTGRKVLLTIWFKKENPTLQHLIFLSAFIEKYYDLFYLILFSQYKDIEELKTILSGTFIHKLRENIDAVKIKKMSTDSPPYLELIVLSPVVLVLLSLIKRTPDSVKKDVYERLCYWIIKIFPQFKTRTEELQENLIEAQIFKTNAEALKACREAGLTPAYVLASLHDGKIRLPMISDKPPTVSKHIESHQKRLSSKPPRKDIYKLICLFRHEKHLRNPLKDEEVANLIELFEELVNQEFESLAAETGGFDIDIKELPEDEQESQSHQP